VVCNLLRTGREISNIAPDAEQTIAIQLNTNPTPKKYARDADNRFGLRAEENIVKLAILRKQ
jgi:hypothetical protein